MEIVEDDDDDDDDHTWPAPYGDSGGRNVEQGRSSTCTRSENYTSLYILYVYTCCLSIQLKNVKSF